ncbi:MAG: hypothetical protein JST54_34140 [Deltaproteobacteria bacterium]|nr:hypothetical protein [Deltaproteobacteria bacterium]
MRAAAPHALVLLAFSGLTVFQTWPVARDWRTHLVGGTNDTLMNAWHMWWMRQALWVHPHNPFQTPLLHHPLGAQLYWHTLAPIKTAWGAVLLGFLTADQAYNWVFLATFVAAGYTSWLLLRYLLGRGGFGPLLAALGAFAGACAFDFSRYHLCQAFAHLNLSSVEGIPFYLLCFFRYLDDGGRKHLWGAALAALYVALCDYYYLAYVATFSALWVVGACWSKGGVFRLATLRDPTVRRALWVGAAAALCCSPLLAALGAHAFPAPVNTMHGDSDYYVDAMGLLGPDRFSAFAGTLASWKTTVEKLPGNTEENGFFLGYLTVALALFGLVRGIPDGRRWAMLGLFYLVLSFGIHLSVDGKTDLPPQYLVGMFALLALVTAPLRTAGPRRDMAIFLTLATIFVAKVPITVNGSVWMTHVPMPYALFKSVVPFFSRGGMPNRFELLTVLAMSVMVAFGAAHLGRLASKLSLPVGAAVALGLAVVPNIEFLSAPFPMMKVGDTLPIFDIFRNEPEGVAIFTDAAVTSEYEQTRYGKPISHAHLSRVPVAEMDLINGRLWKVLGNNEDLTRPVRPLEQAAMRAYLADHHFKYYLCHYVSADRDKFVTGVLGGEPFYKDQYVEAFKFPYVK